MLYYWDWNSFIERRRIFMLSSAFPLQEASLINVHNPCRGGESSIYLHCMPLLHIDTNVDETQSFSRYLFNKDPEESYAALLDN